MTVKINGSEWNVFRVETDNEKLFCDEQCYGVTYFDEKEIYVDRGLSRKMLEKTVVHELTHAFLYEHGIDTENSDGETEEAICNFAETNFKKILKLAAKIVKVWKRDMKNGVFS